MTNLLEYRQITKYYVNSDRVQLGHFVICLTDIHSEHPLGTDVTLVMKYSKFCISKVGLFVRHSNVTLLM